MTSDLRAVADQVTAPLPDLPADLATHPAVAELHRRVQIVLDTVEQAAEDAATAAQAGIRLYQEYRQQHGYNDQHAEAAAIAELKQGTRALLEIPGRLDSAANASRYTFGSYDARTGQRPVHAESRGGHGYWVVRQDNHLLARDGDWIPDLSYSQSGEHYLAATRYPRERAILTASMLADTAPVPGQPLTVPANQQVRCAAEPSKIRAWLGSPSEQEPATTVAQTLGIDDTFRVVTTRPSTEMDRLLATADDAAVFGLPGHDVEILREADQKGFVVGHLIAVDRHDGTRLASRFLEGELVDPSLSGVDAAISLLQRVAVVANEILDASHRSASTGPTRASAPNPAEMSRQSFPTAVSGQPVQPAAERPEANRAQNNAPQGRTR
jgi:hypothetical protein